MSRTRTYTPVEKVRGMRRPLAPPTRKIPNKKKLKQWEAICPVCYEVGDLISGKIQCKRCGYINS